MTVSGLSEFATTTIERLRLAPHPEGGWYRRTWQSETAVGGGVASAAGEDGDACNARPLVSLIHFLLPAGDASAWHMVDADEIWLWHGPGEVTIELGGCGVAPDVGAATRCVLGCGSEGRETQVVIGAGTWQRTLPGVTDVLCSCVVSPGFTYAGFSLAD